MNIYKVLNRLSKKEGEWKMNKFINLKNNYSYVQENKTSESLYDNFREWIINNVKKDNEDILNKKLEYLYETYISLVKTVSEEVSTDLRFKLMVLNNESANKLEKYTSNRIKEHVFITNKKLDDYKKYTDLASWYVNTPEKTNKVVNNLYKIQKEKKFNLKSHNQTTTMKLKIEPTEIYTLKGE